MDLSAHKKHLKQIILDYEALELGIPCIRKFETPPAPRPLTVCMETPPELDLCHADILGAVSRLISRPFEGGRVTSIQFEDMNVICGTGGRSNRWLITSSDFRTRNQLLHSGLDVSPPWGPGEELGSPAHFALRRYDDVLTEDYKLHLRGALARKHILETFSEKGSPQPL
ncbi:putative uncharacterized protein C19orf81 [Polyodon spathula]|uniref:putative uncharacterized protein C19orf81 n=1 Tax=Polyodon spathula TaxID=7913 RepID=UPI001B7E2825|nr:putative uncharacterized protein C19orf81 [Polyodon spathula]